MEGRPMKLTMSVLVKNHAGILYKVVGHLGHDRPIG